MTFKVIGSKKEKIYQAVLEKCCDAMVDGPSQQSSVQISDNTNIIQEIFLPLIR